MPRLLSVLLPAIFAVALSAGAFDVAREPARRSLIGARPLDDWSWGLAWQFELRGMYRPGGFAPGFGMEGLFKVDGALWLAPAFSILPGGSLAAHSGPGSSAVFGLELRLHARGYAVQWEKGAFFVAGGANVAHFFGDRAPGNTAEHTLDVGAALVFGTEWGRRVRFGLESGLALYYALNRYDAGWLEVGEPNGPIGFQITLARVSVRWYS